MTYRTTGTKWEDLRFPAVGVNFLGVLSPPDRDANDGNALFDASSIETIAITAQLPHSWHEGSELRPHVHWCKTTSNAGTVLWSMTYRWANAGQVFPAYSGAITAESVVGHDDTLDKHAIDKFAAIDGDSKKVSSMLLVTLGRLATGDTYPDDAKLLEFDIHYLSENEGTDEEFSK